MGKIKRHTLYVMDVIFLPDPHDWWDILGVALTEAIKNVSTSVNFPSNDRRKDVVSTSSLGGSLQTF